MGYGPKKTECQDSYCIVDRFCDECYFFAGINFKIYFKFMTGMGLLVKKLVRLQMIIFKLIWKKTLKELRLYKMTKPERVFWRVPLKMRKLNWNHLVLITVILELVRLVSSSLKTFAISLILGIPELSYSGI